MDGTIPFPESGSTSDYAKKEAELNRQFREGTYLGPRPTTPKTAFAGKEESVYGRRQRRMQEDWDRRYEMQQHQQQEAARAYEANRAYELNVRDQFMQESRYHADMEAAAAKQRMDAQREQERASLLANLNQLDPRDPNWMAKASDIAVNFPLGMEDQGVRQIYDSYSKANGIYNEAYKASDQRAKEERERQTQLRRELYNANLDPEEFLDKKAPPGVVRINEDQAYRALGGVTFKREEEKQDPESRALNDYLGSLGEYAAYGDSDASPDFAKAKSRMFGARSVVWKYRNNEKVKSNLPHPKTEKDFSMLKDGEIYVNPEGQVVIFQKPATP